MDMWLVFRNWGKSLKSRAKAAVWYLNLDVVFGSALAAKRLGRTAPCEV